MSPSESIQVMMEKATEGLTGIGIDLSTVVVALIAVLILYIGLAIVVGALWTAVEKESENREG